MQGLRSTSALFWAPDKAGVRQPILILSPFVWGPPRIEQLFARLWHWGLVRNIWRGSPNELHQSVRILLHFTQFCIRRQVRHPLPYGPWEHVPPHVWTDQSNSATTQDDAEDEAAVCVLCCQKRSTVTVCDECKGMPCTQCEVLDVGKYSNPSFGPFSQVIGSVPGFLWLPKHLGCGIFELSTISP